MEYVVPHELIKTHFAAMSYLTTSQISKDSTACASLSLMKMIFEELWCVLWATLLNNCIASYLAHPDRQPSGFDVPSHIFHDQEYRSLLMPAIDNTLDPHKEQIPPNEGNDLQVLWIPWGHGAALF
jgi:hypothetical protein